MQAATLNFRKNNLCFGNINCNCSILTKRPQTNGRMQFCICSKICQLYKLLQLQLTPSVYRQSQPTLFCKCYCHIVVHLLLYFTVVKKPIQPGRCKTGKQRTALHLKSHPSACSKKPYWGHFINKKLSFSKAKALFLKKLTYLCPLKMRVWRNW